MMTDSDPLEGLLVDSGKVDREALANGLKGLVAVDQATGALHFDAGYGRLSSRGKVLAVLLGRKVAALLDLTEADLLATKEIVSQTRLPPGTVAPTLKQLRDLHLVAQDDSKAYYVPPAKLLDALDELGASGKAGVRNDRKR